ncbi:DNA replication licensing factor MCM3 [Sarotherodon galilaeus]
MLGKRTESRCDISTGERVGGILGRAQTEVALLSDWILSCDVIGAPQPQSFLTASCVSAVSGWSVAVPQERGVVLTTPLCGL